ncbi:fibronectin type III domain-containing protein [Atopococcus tabaci]|uniref:fibronectin type III domain-containing protein n=1 Tax=Atopococcus tabaci TaxID=269774 RepID=UPI0003FDE7DA|nr:fibronectin type III domain-containing protein [Atopococcus tabaci]
MAIGLAIFGCESITLESSPEIVEEKPAVAEVKADNTPNRIITTFHGDSRTQMGFNWYTTDRFEDAKVWVSTEEDLSEPLVFDAEASEVTNRYAERTEDGYFLFMNEEGYYTDEGQKGPEWTNGEEVGRMELVNVTEVSYKAVATKL